MNTSGSTTSKSRNSTPSAWWPYGPDDKVTTKIAAAVFQQDGVRSVLKRWVATDVTTNPKIQRELKEFFEQHSVKSVAMTEGNMGCPHEEGGIFRTARTARSGRENRGAQVGSDDDGKTVLVQPDLEERCCRVSG